MGMVIGGERAWRRFRKGDIAIALHWINGEPAMVLFPAHMTESRVQRIVPFVIPLSVGHEYVASDGHPNLLRALQGATEAAICLGMAPELSTVHRIIDAIVEAIPDLVAMPPEPTALQRIDQGPAVGELSIQVDGQVVKEVEVTDPTGAGQWNADGKATTEESSVAQRAGRAQARTSGTVKDSLSVHPARRVRDRTSATVKQRLMVGGNKNVAGRGQAQGAGGRSASEMGLTTAREDRP